MANVVFKKGLLKDLTTTVGAEGQILFTTDEHAIYLDIDASNRIRIGDLIEVATRAELPEQGGIASAFYYVKEDKTLNKWNGQWDTLNVDTGAIAIEATGDGAAAIEVKYEAQDRKIIVTVPEVLINQSALDTKIGNIEESQDVATFVTSKLAEALKGLSGAMHYKGEVKEDPSTMEDPGSTYAAGDVVTYNQKEFVYDGTKAQFIELGDVTAEQQRLSDIEAKLDGINDTVVKYVTDETQKLVGTSETEAQATTIKGAVDEAKRYADSLALAWEEFTTE